jgi:ABC-type dipeptide/oligopeptide/nickel transport system permease subunit
MSVGAPELLYETEAAAAAELDGTTAPTSPQLFVRRLLADRVATVSAALIVLLILVAILAPLIVKAVGAAGPSAVDPSARDRFGDPVGPSHNALWPFIALLVGAALAMASRLVPVPPIRRYGAAAIFAVGLLAAIGLGIAFWPGAHHIFGVDRGFHDLFSRVFYGARVSLEVAALAAAVSMIIGTTFGVLAGYFGGWIDRLISRLTGAVLTFPILLLALGVAAACKLGHGCLGGLLEPGRTVAIVVIALFTSPYAARLVRDHVLSLREADFVKAARSLGTSNGRIISSEILPNVVAPIFAFSAVILAQNVLLEAGLSYLGAGAQDSWGAMLADASSVFYTAWWYMLFPGAALLISVLAFNLLADGLRDAMRPQAGGSWRR